MKIIDKEDTKDDLKIQYVDLGHIFFYLIYIKVYKNRKYRNIHFLPLHDVKQSYDE